MAPAGSYESLQAAIQAGADAVYFGVEKLNMRSRSSFNFTIKDLDKIVSICKKAGIKTYLALNSVIYSDELDLVKDIISASQDAGITAVIASDQSVIGIARDIGLEVHLSTQLNITNIESLRFYSAYADVVVLARELTLDRIADIASEITRQDIRGPSGNLVRLELFIHGALCMAISGKCYLSLHQYGYSANRGDCLQACRRSYIVEEKDTGKELEIFRDQIMSPKDLCTISFIDKILDTGVSVLKIEGRARSPEYVKTVTECYNQAIQQYCNGSFSQQAVKQWKEKLATVFNRGFWDGYYLGQEHGEWTEAYGSRASKRKVYIGKGMNYFSQLGVGEFLVESGELQTGDDILITGPTTGVIEMSIQGIQVNRKMVSSCSRGENFSIKVPDIIRRSDKLYKIVNSSQAEQQ